MLNIFTVVVYAALGGFTFFFAVYLQNVVGWSAFRTGIALLPMTLLLLVGSARAGALSARIGPRLPLAIGPVVAAVGLLLLRGVGPGASYWTDVLPGVLLFGIGLTLVVAPLTASVLAAVQDRFSGVASGFNNAASRAGGLLAVAALPLLVGLSGSGYAQKAELTDAFRGAMAWCAGLLLAGGACWPSCWCTGRPARPRRRSPATRCPPPRPRGRTTSGARRGASAAGAVDGAGDRLERGGDDVGVDADAPDGPGRRPRTRRRRRPARPRRRTARARRSRAPGRSMSTVGQRVDERVDRAVADAGRASAARRRASTSAAISTLPSTVDDRVAGQRPPGRRWWSTRYSRGEDLPHLRRARPRRPRRRCSCWTTPENSICSRRGRSRWCSVFMM